MRKFLSVALATAAAFTGSGCIMVIGTREQVADLDHDRRVVQIDGELWLIDTDAKTAKRLDDAAISQPERVERLETESDQR